jgi:hypothetical protein
MAVRTDIGASRSQHLFTLLAFLYPTVFYGGEGA